jgi:hypothetical protein
VNTKKFIAFLILFSGILGCECFYGGTEWNVARFHSDIRDKMGNPPSHGIIEGDSVKLFITFEAEFVEHIPNPFQAFMNSAYATSCTYPGDDGIQDKIISFVVTSNSDFNTIEAGKPLNELLLVNRKKSIEDWIAGCDSWMFRHEPPAELLFIEKPTIPGKHVFTLKLETVSGEIFEEITEEIQWN